MVRFKRRGRLVVHGIRSMQARFVRATLELYSYRVIVSSRATDPSFELRTKEVYDSATNPANQMS